MRNYKNKNLAALLAFFGGIVGLQRFYLGQRGLGFLMIIASVITLGILSSIIGVIDSIVFLTMSDEKFDFKYNNPDNGPAIQRKPRYHSYERRHDNRQFSGNGESPYRRDRRMNKSEYRDRKIEKEKTNQQSFRNSRRRSSSKTKTQRKNDSRIINTLKENGIEKFKEFDIEGSVLDFKKILDIDPYHIAAHFNLACAYSQLEKPEMTMYHISMAVKAGFNDFDRIKKHDKLAFARIQPEWEDFVKDGFIFDINKGKEIQEEISEPQVETEESTVTEEINDTGQSDLLEHLKKLKDQRERGIITEVEFEIERRKLMTP